jgi:4-hydroxy-tetrahydrodipicolinate synthase
MTASPTCTKAALNLLGHRAGGLRLPLVEATDAELAAVGAMLARHGLLDATGADAHATAGAPSARAPGA